MIISLKLYCLLRQKKGKLVIKIKKEKLFIVQLHNLKNIRENIRKKYTQSKIFFSRYHILISLVGTDRWNEPVGCSLHSLKEQAVRKSERSRETTR